jgi:hypothetical protein
MDSANAKAKEMPYCSNMTISAALVIEMSNRIAELERSIIKQGGLHAHRTEKLAETTTNLVYSYKRIAELEKDLNTAKSIIVKTANNIVEADNCEQGSDESDECWECLKEFALVALGRVDT